MYKVTIGSFENISINGRIEHYTINDKNIKKIICIKNDNCMIDIENGYIYPTIKRTNGFIDKNQNILLNHEYALYSEEYKNPNIKDYLLALRLLLTNKTKQKRK